MRENVYRIACVLSIVFVLEALLMAWVLPRGGYAIAGYFGVGLTLMFIPAFFFSLIILAIYREGFAQKSWTVRKSEVVFFVVFVLAVAVKLVFFLWQWR